MKLTIIFKLTFCLYKLYYYVVHVQVQFHMMTDCVQVRWPVADNAQGKYLVVNNRVYITTITL